MNSPKNYLLAFLALTTLGGAWLAWRQYGELVELRAGALHRDERLDLQKRISDLERLNRELQDQLAAARGSDVDHLLAEATERASDERGPRGDRSRGDNPRGRGSDMRQQFTALRELMAKPEVQAMLSAQQKAAIEGRYAALFKNLSLSPEQAEKLKTLLAERGNTRRDIEEVARAQGINPRENPEAFRKLFTDAQNEINASIKSVIGDQGFAQLQTYEQTLPQRNLVENLQQRLAYSNSPLTSTQAEQLIQILASNAPQRTATTTTTSPASAPSTDATPPPPGRGPGGFGGPGFGPPGGPDLGRLLGGGFGGPPPGGASGNAIVTPAAVAQAQTMLTPNQLAALQQVQQQQQAQQQLQQLVRDTLSANAPATQSGSPAPSSGTPPTRKRGGG